MRARTFYLHHSTIKKLGRLKKEAEQDGVYRVAKRLHAVLLCAGGRSSNDIAPLLSAPRSKVSEWLRRYEDIGVDGLLEGYRIGRPRELLDKHERQLGDIIESGPTAYGFLGGVWTSPMMTKVIKEEFGVSYHPGHVRKILDRLGFSVQRPKRLLAKADPDKLNRWRRYQYPRIKKKREQNPQRSSSKTRPASGKTAHSTRHGHDAVTNR